MKDIISDNYVTSIEIDINDILKRKQEEGVDTFMIYEIGCVGCLIKPHTYYVFSKRNSLNSVKKYYGSYTSKAVNINDVFSLYYNNLPELNSDKEPFIASLLHYRYKRISFYENGNLLFKQEMQIPNNVSNKKNKFINLLNYLDSQLMWIESNELQWNS